MSSHPVQQLNAPKPNARKLPLDSLLEWMGAAFGVTGALLLASNTAWSPWGWVGFLCSNVMLIAFAVRKHFRGLLVMQMVFTTTSLLGIYRWWFS
jgi:hypothetical protein